MLITYLNTSSIIKHILNDGVLYPGKYLYPVQRKFCGEECPSDYIYTNIYFEDIKNIDYTWGASVILHPKIMLAGGLLYGCTLINKFIVVYIGLVRVNVIIWI